MGKFYVISILERSSQVLNDSRSNQSDEDSISKAHPIQACL